MRCAHGQVLPTWEGTRGRRARLDRRGLGQGAGRGREQNPPPSRPMERGLLQGPPGRGGAEAL